MKPTQAARIIGCSPQQVRTLVRNGKLKARKIKTEDNQHGYIYLVDSKSVNAYAKTFHGNRGVKK